MTNAGILGPHRSRARAVGAVLASVLVPLAALAADESRRIPRRPDGRPDLSGTYDVATLTPLVRPARFGNQLTMTDEEAKQYADYWLANLARDAQPSDPNRSAPPVGGQDFYIPEYNGAAGGVGGYNAFFVDLGTSTFKIDGKYRTSIITEPKNGRLPPLTPDGQQRMAIELADYHPNTGDAWWIDREQGPYDDPELRPLGERCLLGFGSTSGPPMLPDVYNNNYQIVQSPDAVMILVEMVHDARVVRMNGKHLPQQITPWMGDSVGRWEGDTLVVETTNLHPGQKAHYGIKQRFYLPPTGKVTERFTRVGENEIVYQFTVEDSAAYTQPWKGEVPLRRTQDLIYEYACHEGNYALPGILAGAREQEKKGK
jgi:hypothetical protein